MEQPPISIILEKLGVPHSVFRHENPVHSFEQAASERGQRPSQVVRSILFRVTEGEYAMVLMAGQTQVSWKKLRQALGRSRISMASEEEVLEVTGYRIGAVGPFGLLKQARVLIEAGVLNEEEISIGSGMRSVAVILKTRDLQNALKDAEVIDLVD
jgi:Cys-tRNA(Pro) deacylase